MSLLPINQFAKKSGVTSETLRHYDRIGLLKPYSQNESGVRFYHVEQYEKLSTIKELKSLDLTLAEIKDFFEDRQIQTSLKLIEHQLQVIRQRQESLASLERKLVKRQEFLQEVLQGDYEFLVVRKQLPEATFLRQGLYFENPVQLYEAVMELEGQVLVDEKLGIFGLPRYAVLRDASSGLGELLLAVEDSATEDLYHREVGDYYTCYVRGDILNGQSVLPAIQSQADKDEVAISSTYLTVVRFDDSLTDDKAERLYEVQVKILEK
ncbi:MerR family transcriptional regulator [Streptococcus suis]|uniref:MerR family transcriptional regulator n=1 Tax=Streptococcus suis TaxID=1307 RepID=UPI000CF3FBB0|nr:MerR family transcriptional regulator [Streptococcus suis]HEM4973918.1 MerR family transcriptional regulator [Streptococcus suis]HEM5057708.1 MerR family transcriptional regulator [Streptococcus suis]HEM5068110.1 MerR family transcriptional regulator [Streptococcus suis]HEM5164766.1 MerR family transcriptional regulator [Streptococcus suis]HEM5287510.1 MerR family transcriptional regulator [Streptococcus suis]